MQFIKNRFAKITLWLIAGILFLFIATAAALQTPYIQTRVLQHLASWLTKKTGFETTIDRVSIDWFDRFSIEGISIIDPDNNPMGAISQLNVNYRLSSLINNEDILIDHVAINKADVLLAKIPESDTSFIININLYRDRIQALSSGSGNAPKKINIDAIDLSGSSFTYIDNTKDSIAGRFDYYHFTIKDVNSKVTQFGIIRDTVDFKIHRLRGVEPQTGLVIHNLETDFFLNKKTIRLNKLDTEIGDSHIRDHLTFQFDSYADFSDFNNEVELIANLRNSLVSMADIDLIYPLKKKISRHVNVTGDFKGKISRFRFSNFTMEFDLVNMVQGQLSMYGLPTLEETFVDLRLTRSYIETAYIKEFFQPRTQKLLGQFEHASFSGKFLGFANDFVAAGDFTTDLGKVKSNINLKFFENAPAKYTGNLQVIDFRLGKYLGNPIFDKVSLSGDIKGSGLSTSSADFVLKGKIQEIDIRNYRYKNISTDARFAQEFFKGDLAIDDPHLKMKAKGDIDLRENKDRYNVHLSLEHAQLDSLKLVNKDLFVVADIEINGSGLSLDALSGNAHVKDVFIDYNNTPLYFDSLDVLAENRNEERRFKLTSDLVDWEFSGQYNYSQLFKEISTLFREYKLNLRNDYDEIQHYYANKPKVLEPGSNILYNVQLKDMNPLIHLIPGDNQISKNVNLQGVYQSGYTTIIAFSSTIDTLTYKGNTFIGNAIDVSASKIADSTSVLAGVYVHSAEQTLTNTINTQNLLIETFWDRNQVVFETNIDQNQHNNTLQLKGTVDFLPDTTVIHFDSSKMVVLENRWNFDQGNTMSISNQHIQFNKFNIQSGDRLVALSGSIAPNKKEEAQLKIQNFNMEFINPIINKHLSGMLNGYLNFRDYYGNPIIENELTIDHFEVDSFLVGDIFGKTTWRNRDNSLKVKAFVDREGFQTINVNGHYYPNITSNPLELRASFDQANINILEPFLGSYFSNITGNATGVFKISGRPNAPIIEGSGHVENGSLTIDYLNTNYSFSGDIGFNESNIVFKQLSLEDVAKSKGTLSGKISHNNFKNMVLDLEGNIENFQVLNTASRHNKLFYGTGFVTGKVNFIGPVSNLSINALATTNKGTRIFIPLDYSEGVEQEEYISFVSLKDSVHIEQDTKEEVKVSGIKLNFDLDITPDAYCEIIFDIKSGDIIRGRGNGRINMQIDTQGEFNMFGDYVIQEGGYNFTLYNIINKEFSINPNSKISWFGNPYEGMLDIDASYNQLTPLLPLVTDTSFHSAPAIRRSYPVDLKLNIDGPLSQPKIGFDIDVTGYPIQAVTNNNGQTMFLEDVVTPFKNRIRNDEHELNRQVFSLLVLRKFSPPESFNTGGSIGNSVSEFVSNQLSYWVSQVDENLEIDVDLGSLDQEAFNTFQLRLSYTLLDGRLRISREGGFSNNNSAEQSDVTGIVGDWTVEYLLTEDGKLRAKMYNRTNYNALNNTLGGGNTITTGVSLLHTQNFNQLRDLWKQERKKKEKEELPESTEAVLNPEDEIE